MKLLKYFKVYKKNSHSWQHCSKRGPNVGSFLCAICLQLYLFFLLKGFVELKTLLLQSLLSKAIEKLLLYFYQISLLCTKLEVGL